MSAAACSTVPAVSSLSTSSSTISTAVKAHGPVCSFRCPNFVKPNFASNPSFNPSRLRISHRIVTPKHVFGLPIFSCLDAIHSEAYPESGSASVSSDSHTEATVDLKLPRRSLLVHFTCNSCGERTQKLINRLAYERGTVFVQICASKPGKISTEAVPYVKNIEMGGCLQHHKLVDNLGLVVEYDLRDEMGMDSNADQV